MPLAGGSTLRARGRASPLRSELLRRGRHPSRGPRHHHTRRHGYTDPVPSAAWGPSSATRLRMDAHKKPKWHPPYANRSRTGTPTILRTTGAGSDRSLHKHKPRRYDGTLDRSGPGCVSRGEPRCAHPPRLNYRHSRRTRNAGCVARHRVTRRGRQDADPHERCRTVGLLADRRWSSLPRARSVTREGGCVLRWAPLLADSEYVDARRRRSNGRHVATHDGRIRPRTLGAVWGSSTGLSRTGPSLLSTSPGRRGAGWRAVRAWPPARRARQARGSRTASRRGRR